MGRRDGYLTRGKEIARVRWVEARVALADHRRAAFVRTCVCVTQSRLCNSTTLHSRYNTVCPTGPPTPCTLRLYAPLLRDGIVVVELTPLQRGYLPRR